MPSQRSRPATDIVGDRHSLLMIGMLAVWAACVIFAIARAVVTFQTGRSTPWWANATGAVVMTILYTWYRRRPESRSAAAASGTALVATIALLVPLAYGMSSTVWWLSLVGFAMVLLGRRGEAWAWGMAIPLVVLAASVIEPWIQLPGAAGEPPLERVLARIVFVVLLVGMAAAFRRVAERRATELHDSDERYRMLFQRVPVGVFHCDRDLRVTDCNDRFLTVVGGTRDSIAGGDLSVLTDQRVLSAIRQALRGEQSSYDGPYRDSAGGGQRSVSLRTVPLYGEESAVIGALGIVEDVTERLRMEEEVRRSRDELELRVRERTDELRRSRKLLANILDSIPQGVAWKDTASVYLGCNPVFARAAGLAKPAEIVGKTDSELPWRDRAKAFREEDRQVVEEGRTVRVVQPEELADGSVDWISATKAPLVDAAGAVFGVLGVFEDVTERKLAEGRLERSERNYRTVFEEANDAVLVFEPESETILDANPRACRIYGFSREELVGMSLKALTKDVPRGEESIRRVVEDGVFHGFESIHLARDGREIHFLINSSLIEYEGRPAILSMNRDITERRHAVAALRESEERYRSLFEQAPIGIYRTAPSGAILAANPALVRKLGYSSFEELASRDLEVEGFAEGSPREEFKKRIERDGEVMGFESSWLTKDGQVLNVRESARAVRDRDGRTLYYEGAAEDVTAERLAEEERRRLVAAVEQAAETIVITDTSGRIEYVNPAFERTSGYTREEAIHRKNSIVKSGIHDDRFYAELWRTITRGETWEGHFVNRRKDGTLYEEEATISPIRDHQGKIVSFVAVKRDVTQEVALQAQLREAQKMEMVGQLVGGIAHDFNNILQAMLASVQVAHLDGTIESLTQAVTELETEVQRGSALTRQLLFFARRLPAERRLVDLTTVVNEHARMLKRLLPENISVAIEIRDGELFVEGDAAQLGQVLINLAVNARDAMPEGGALSLWMSRLDGRAVLAVSDSGVGMDAETREHLFEPFFTTKPPHKGTGLGLAVVWGIVKEHGGTVEVESEPGHGSTFKVILPTVSRPVEVETPTAESIPRGRGQRVLLIEDDDIVRGGVSRQLALLGYAVTEASSAEKATELPLEPAFEILLTDFKLTGATGLDVARTLRERWPELKVVLMSGYAPEELDQVLALGAFLQKPFTLETLARTLKTVEAEPKDGEPPTEAT